MRRAPPGRIPVIAAAVFAVGVLAVALDACGGSTTSSASGGAVARLHDGSGEDIHAGTRGGVLTAYDHSDFGSLDPGESYSALDYEVTLATQRSLFAYPPNESTTLVPDLASGPAIVSGDGRTVTVQIKHGIRFSPPVNREVTSADVAYAIERGANPNVANGYFPVYFSNIVGANTARGGPIPGIVTPSRYMIVFHLTGPYGTFFASALSMPLTAPVPKSFAAPLDAHKPTEYGSRYEVATGPYMLRSDGKGKFLGIGYDPGRSATLVRNPNWNPASDSRPAYLDRININIGGDPNVIGRQVLMGSHAIQNDQLAPEIVKLAYQRYYSQLAAVPGTGEYFVALNNSHGPFRNVNVRKALWAALDRNAMLKANGGLPTAALGTHYIYPGVAGYGLAGGDPGPAVDYDRFPAGNMALAAKYMKAAGYPSGKYTGSAAVKVVGATGAPYARPAEIVDHTLHNLGFTTRFALVDQSVMFTKYCGTPAREIDVCPSAGWTRDFADPQTNLEPIFAGYNIVPAGTANLGQVNNPQVNAAMRAAARLTDPAARARAWAAIDRMLVNIAAAVPWAFVKNPTIESRDVRGINNLSNAGFWDYSYSSLK